MERLDSGSDDKVIGPRIPKDLAKRLRREAFEADVSQNVIVTEAIRRELDRREAARKKAEARSAPQ